MSGEEISDAENHVIKEMQKEAFKDEYSTLLSKRQLSSSGKLVGLCLKLDGDGIIKLDGQLTYAELLSYDVRYPAILPHKKWVIKLIVKHYYELGNHQAGTNHTLCLFVINMLLDYVSP